MLCLAKTIEIQSGLGPSFHPNNKVFNNSLLLLLKYCMWKVTCELFRNCETVWVLYDQASKASRMNFLNHSCPSTFFRNRNRFNIFHRIKKGPLKYSHLFCRFWRIYEFFFKIPKIQKLYNIRAIFLRVVWTSKRSKWSLKFQKTRFFQAFFSLSKRPWKNVFFAILKTTSIFSMFKLLSKILHGYYTTFVFLEFWKKLINSSKSAKQVGIL